MDKSSVDKTLEIAAIRERLNELRFEKGRRRLQLGLASEIFADHSQQEIDRKLARLRQQLEHQDLTLERSADDQLFVVQQLRHRPTDINAMARAMQWVSRITTVALEMVVPAMIGAWLDQQFDTKALTLVGLLIGVPLGLWHLIKMTKT